MTDALSQQMAVLTTLLAYGAGLSLWLLSFALALGFWRRSRRAFAQRSRRALPRLVLAGILCTGLLVLTIGGVGVAALIYTDDQEYDEDHGNCGC